MVAVSPVRPTLAEVEAVLDRFRGAIVQQPPAYSALKVDGERAYARARAGEVLVMAERGVTVFALTIQPAHAEPVEARPVPRHPRDEGGVLDSVALALTCSKGTYVRSLAARHRGRARHRRPRERAPADARGAVRDRGAR